MERSGWTQGKGLGRNEDGMSEALKVKIKADNAGVGHDPGEQFTFHWWEHVFAKSAGNITVTEGDDGVKVHTKNKTELASTKRKQKLKNKEMLYGNFVKSGTLENGKISKNDGSSSDSDSEDDNKPKMRTLTDEELLAACGGRTAHKGARHGVNLSGKLARLEEQESKALAASTKKTKKKKSKKKKSDEETDEQKEADRVDCKEKVESKRTKKAKKAAESANDRTNSQSEDCSGLATQAASETTKKVKKKKRKLDVCETPGEIEALKVKKKKKKKDKGLRDE